MNKRARHADRKTSFELAGGVGSTLPPVVCRHASPGRPCRCAACASPPHLAVRPSGCGLLRDVAVGRVAMRQMNGLKQQYV
uniref:Uncharacterized protein n=1 Tax=Oryza nivara TaxID=4536 RepID=A0A0E0I164_ORYNI